MFKACIIQFPGNNCEIETLRSLVSAGFDAEIFRWNKAASGLSKYKFIVLEGGFGYEDRGRSGLVISFDPIMEKLKSLAEQGTIIMGVCNGAQALVESGLIPGVENDALGLALAKNKRVRDGQVVGTGYFSTDVHIKSVSAQGRSPFNYQLPEKEILEVPIAHGEGRFVTKTPALEHALWEHQQILFQYCSADGAVLDEYPINPNGSMHNIAAICNPKGNVMAIMPHPERGITAPGKIIFESVFNWLKEKRHLKTFFDAPDALSVPLVAIKPEPLSTPNKTLDLYIKLIIADNEEYTIQKTLERLDTIRDISLSKYKFCRIHFKKTINKTQLKTILKSGLVANTQKEHVTVRNKTSWSDVSKNYKISPAENLYESDPGIIVEYREDSLGDALSEKLSTLLPRCGIVRVETGVMWQFHGTKKPTKKELESLYTHRLFWNPNSQACYVIPN